MPVLCFMDEKFSFLKMEKMAVENDVTFNRSIVSVSHDASGTALDKIGDNDRLNLGTTASCSRFVPKMFVKKRPAHSAENVHK